MKKNLIYSRKLMGRQIIASAILFAFLVTSVAGTNPVFALDFRLPAPGVIVHLSPPLDPPILKGIKVHPDNPFRFDFILDKGERQLSDNALKDESNKLIKYFLASLTIPEKDLWVNLSPYEKDRIIPQSFGLTEMGRDLLAEDYMLKQITASLIYPEDEIGKKFWKRVYTEASKKFGTTNIPVNTFNKVWIVPEKAVVFENANVGTAYVVKSELKVMLEQDYLSLQKHEGAISKVQAQEKETNQLGSQIVREIIIPQLTKEVNEDKNFSQLRQVYNSLILATWYKKKIKDSILEQVYANKNKVAGVSIDDPHEEQKIYKRYLQAFKKGVYNYIKEEVDPATQETMSRKYFSGGLTMNAEAMDAAMSIIHNTPVLPNTDRALLVQTDIDPFDGSITNETKLDLAMTVNLNLLPVGDDEIIVNSGPEVEDNFLGDRKRLMRVINQKFDLPNPKTYTSNEYYKDGFIFNKRYRQLYRGQLIAWVIKRTDAERFATAIGESVRRADALLPVQGDETKVMAEALSFRIRGDAGPLLKQVNKIFSLPDPKNMPELEIERKGVRFYKREGPVLTFKTADFIKIAEGIGRKLLQDLKLVGKKQITVSANGVKGKIQGNINKIADEIKVKYELPNEEETDLMQYEKNGVPFFKMLRGVKIVWAFDEKSLISVVKAIQRNLFLKVPPVRAQDVVVSDSGLKGRIRGHDVADAIRDKFILPDITIFKGTVVRRSFSDAGLEPEVIDNIFSVLKEKGWLQMVSATAGYLTEDYKVIEDELKIKESSIVLPILNEAYKTLQYESRGILFSKKVRFTEFVWTFDDSNLPKVTKEIGRNLSVTLQTIGDNDIGITERINKFIRGDVWETAHAIYEYYSLPDPETVEETEIERKGVTFNRRMSGTRIIWTFDRTYLGTVATAIKRELQDIDAFIDEQIRLNNLEETVSALVNEPGALATFLLLTTNLDPDLIHRLVQRSYKGLRGVSVEEINFEDYEQAEGKIILDSVPTETGEPFILITGKIEGDFNQVLVRGGRNRIVNVRKDGTFQTRIILATGEDIFISFLPINQEKKIYGKGEQVKVKQTSPRKNLDEIIADLLAKKAGLLESLEKDPIRWNYLQARLEVDTLGQFTENEDDGFAYLKARISDAPNPLLKRLYERIEEKFREVNKIGTKESVMGFILDGVKSKEETGEDDEPFYFYQKYTIYESIAHIREYEKAVAENRTDVPPGLILALEQGLGKTRIAISIVRDDPQGALIIAPKSVVSSWEREDAEVFGEPRVVVATGSNKQKAETLSSAPADSLRLVNRDFLRQDVNSDDFQALNTHPNQYVLIDESSFTNRTDSNQTRGAKNLKRRYTILISATPVAKPEDIRTTLEFMTGDKGYQDKQIFKKEVLQKEGVDAYRILHFWFSKFMIRIKKKDVFKTYDPDKPLEEQSRRLPAKVHIEANSGRPGTGAYGMLEEQEDAILRVITNWPGWQEEKARLNKEKIAIDTTDDQERQKSKTEDFFSKIHALRQIMNDPRYIGIHQDSNKRKQVDQILREELDKKKGGKAVIFCNYVHEVKSYYERYQKKYGAGTYYGDTVPEGYQVNSDGYLLNMDSSLARFSNIAQVESGKEQELKPDPLGHTITALDYNRLRFQSDPNAKVLIVSYKSGAFGVKFTAANAVIFSDLPDDFVTLYQAEDRANRIDSNRKKYTINYYRLEAHYSHKFLQRVKELAYVYDRDIGESKVILESQVPSEMRNNERYVVWNVYEKAFKQGTLEQVINQRLKVQEQILELILDEPEGQEDLDLLDKGRMKQAIPLLFGVDAKLKKVKSEEEPQTLPTETPEQRELSKIKADYPEAFQEGRLSDVDVLNLLQDETKEKVAQYFAGKAKEGIKNWDEVLWVMERFPQYFDELYIDLDDTLFTPKVYRGSNQWFYEEAQYFVDGTWHLNALKGVLERDLLTKGFIRPTHPRLISVLKEMKLENPQLKIKCLTSRRAFAANDTDKILMALGWDDAEVEYGLFYGKKLSSIKKDIDQKDREQAETGGLTVFVDDSLDKMKDTALGKSLQKRGVIMVPFQGAPTFNLESSLNLFLTASTPSAAMTAEPGPVDHLIDALLLSRLSDNVEQRVNIYLNEKVLFTVLNGSDDVKMAYIEALTDFFSRSFEKQVSAESEEKILDIYYGLASYDKELWKQEHRQGKISYQKIDRSKVYMKGIGNYELIIKPDNVYLFLEPLLRYLVQEKPDVIILPDTGARPYKEALEYFIAQKKLSTKVIIFPISNGDARDTSYELARWMRLLKGTLQPVDDEDKKLIEYLRNLHFDTIKPNSHVVILDDNIVNGVSCRMIKKVLAEEFQSRLEAVFEGFDYGKRQQELGVPVYSSYKTYGAFSWRNTIKHRAPAVIARTIWEWDEFFKGVASRERFKVPPARSREPGKGGLVREEFQKDYEHYFASRTFNYEIPQPVVFESQTERPIQLNAAKSNHLKDVLAGDMRLVRNKGILPAWVFEDDAISERDKRILQKDNVYYYDIVHQGNVVGFVILSVILDQQQNPCLVIDKIQPKMVYDNNLDPRAVVNTIKNYLLNDNASLRALFMQAYLIRDVSESHKLRRKIELNYSRMPVVEEKFDVGNEEANGAGEVGTISLLWRRMNAHESQRLKEVAALFEQTTERLKQRKQGYLQKVFGAQLSLIAETLRHERPIEDLDENFLVLKELNRLSDEPVETWRFENIEEESEMTVHLRCWMELEKFKQLGIKPDFRSIVMRGPRYRRKESVMKFFFNYLWDKGFDLSNAKLVDLQASFHQWGLDDLYQMVAGSKGKLLDYIAPGCYVRNGRYKPNVSAHIPADNFERYLKGEWYALAPGMSYTVQGEESVPSDATVPKNFFTERTGHHFEFHLSNNFGVMAYDFDSLGNIQGFLFLEDHKIHYKDIVLETKPVAKKTYLILLFENRDGKKGQFIGGFRMGPKDEKEVIRELPQENEAMASLSGKVGETLDQKQHDQAMATIPAWPEGVPSKIPELKTAIIRTVPLLDHFIPTFWAGWTARTKAEKIGTMLRLIKELSDNSPLFEEAKSRAESKLGIPNDTWKAEWGFYFDKIIFYLNSSLFVKNGWFFDIDYKEGHIRRSRVQFFRIEERNGDPVILAEVSEISKKEMPGSEVLDNEIGMFYPPRTILLSRPLNELMDREYSLYLTKAYSIRQTNPSLSQIWSWVQSIKKEEYKKLRRMLTLREEWKHMLDYEAWEALGQRIDKERIKKMLDISFPRDSVNPVKRLVREIFDIQVSNLNPDDWNQVITWYHILTEVSSFVDELLFTDSQKYLLVSICRMSWPSLDEEHGLAKQIVLHAIEKIISNDTSPVRFYVIRDSHAFPTVASLGPQALLERVKEIERATIPPEGGNRLKKAEQQLLEKINNKAMISGNHTGGIDFTSRQMPLRIRNSGQEIKFHLDPAMLQRLQNAPGFVPVIISIQPMTDLKAFLINGIV